MNKDVLVALIAKDVNELQTLTVGLDQMQTIPAPYLRLALDKSKALTENIESLIIYLEDKEIADKLEAQHKAELEAKQAELARIAEEQEMLLRAQELERERQAEERRKAEIEIARQVAAIEAARQAELEEKRRREEEEARRKEEERIRLEAEQAEARRKAEAEEQARIQAEQSIDTAATIEAPITTVADSIETSESLADKLAKNADDTLASALNSKKINDLKSAITLGDRFRFQRELFAGNGEKMSKAISDFNSFETMTEAQTYISKNFDWALDNDAVSDFIQLLQRRYL